MVVRVWIVIERTLGRTLLRPNLEGRELLERRQIVAAACVDHLLRRRRRRQIHKEALRGRLVLAELPDAPEGRQEGSKPSLRADREAVRPALLGDLWSVALGDRPGARRVHDQRALPGDQHLVVAGIVPGCDVSRQELLEFL